jgi:hypothetical protein
MLIVYPGLWILVLLTLIEKIQHENFSSLVHSEGLRDLFALRQNVPGHIDTNNVDV